MKWLLLFVVIGAFAVQPNQAQQPTNFFSFFFNNIFRRGSNRISSSSTVISKNSSPSRSDSPYRPTVTVTKTETVQLAPSTTISEFFTVTETLTERLIATSTLTRKMTATATHIITSCPDIGLRRINWKEIPNRIEEIMKYPASGVHALEHTANPDGPYIIGRSIDIESSAEHQRDPVTAEEQY